MTTVWICCRVARCCKDPTPLAKGEHSWELCGVFSTREAAAALCEDCRWFIAPVLIGERLPEGDVRLPGQEWPAPACHAESRACQQTAPVHGGNMSEAYPKREPFYAHRFVRVMAKTCVAQEIGTVAFALLAVVAHTEDSARYRRAITFWDSQIGPIIGARGWKALHKARQAAVAAGWLHYEPGAKGRAGRYWTIIPDHAQNISDAPLDDGEPDGFTSQTGGEKGGEREAQREDIHTYTYP